MRRSIFAFSVAGLITAGTIITECGLRLVGIMNFPLYEKSEQLGYVLAPNQHGAFLNKNDWAFNELSMGVPEPFQPKKYKHNALLIGDSIVLGVNRIPQRHRIGPLLNERCEAAMIWPISANSWAFLNELRYLQLHADVLENFDRIVFILNSGDFGKPSVWASETSTPTYRPWLALIQLAHKLLPDNTTDEGKGSGDWHEGMKWLVERYHRPITIVLYPTKTQTEDAALRSRVLDAHAAELDKHFSIIFLKNEVADWSVADYRDEDHPNVAGNRKIASLLEKHIAECSITQSQPSE